MIISDSSKTSRFQKFFPARVTSYTETKRAKKKRKLTSILHPHKIRITEGIPISSVRTSNLLELFAHAVLIKYAAFYLYFRDPVLGG